MADNIPLKILMHIKNITLVLNGLEEALLLPSLRPYFPLKVSVLCSKIYLIPVRVQGQSRSIKLFYNRSLTHTEKYRYYQSSFKIYLI